MWIGNIIDQLGYNWHDFQCRGEIYDYQMDGNDLMIYQNTAWTEAEGFREVIQKEFPSIDVFYRLEEPGCDVFCTNSFEHFSDRYYLDSYDEPMYFENLKECHDYIVSLVGHDVDMDFGALDAAVNDFQEQQEEKGEDCFYSLHEFLLVED